MAVISKRESAMKPGTGPSGSLDPGVIFYLMNNWHMDARAVEQLLSAWTIPTNEELMIARHTSRLLQ